MKRCNNAFLFFYVQHKRVFVANHAQPGNTEQLRLQLIALLEDFSEQHTRHSLREQVAALVPAAALLQNLGCSLVRGPGTRSARARILAYMQQHVGTVLSGAELMVVAGISEYARRIRELRVQFGWKIVSGVTLKTMEPEELAELFGSERPQLKPDQYILLSDKEDSQAAQRWRVANDIRKAKGLGVRDKILQYLRTFVGAELSGEELRYVAGDKTEWARRTRELRTEFGWPLMTRFTGRPDLPVGIYVLEEDRQAPEHDRKIPDPVYRAVLVRDGYTCQDCGWTHAQWNRSDPRHLEAHHVTQHADGGSNTADNLSTLCTVCHDARHRR